MLYYKIIKIIINILELVKVIINVVVKHYRLFDLIDFDKDSIFISNFL